MTLLVRSFSENRPPTTVITCHRFVSGTRFTNFHIKLYFVLLDCNKGCTLYFPMDIKYKLDVLNLVYNYQLST